MKSFGNFVNSNPVIVINLSDRFVHFKFTYRQFQIICARGPNRKGLITSLTPLALKAATEVAPNDLKRLLSRISFASKGLSLNPNSINKVLNLGSLLEKG